MAADLVEARWSAGYPVQLADGTELQPGDTHEIPAGEAKASDNWQPVRTTKPDKATLADPGPEAGGDA